MSDYIKPLAAVLLPFTGGALNSMVTRPEVKPLQGTKTWYQALNKPKLQPPSWIFPPVWSCLYGTMGYSSYMIWRDGGGFGGDALLPLSLYGTQLALNWAWTPIFFKYHKLGLAAAGRGLLCIAVAATMATAYDINPNATYLLAPYLVWATVEIGALWVAVAATMATAYDINPTATYLLAPYLAWVSFASYLSFSIWRNNKDRTD